VTGPDCRTGMTVHDIVCRWIKQAKEICPHLSRPHNKSTPKGQLVSDGPVVIR